MKRTILAVIASLALVVGVNAQTNPTPASESIPVLGILTTGSNYFVVPFGTYAPKSKDFGGGLALGYKATEALAPMLTINELAGKAYVGNLSLQLSVPQNLLGKIPFTPFLDLGAGIPLSSATVDNNLTISAGNPIGIVGAGAALHLNWMGQAKFFQNAFLAMDYEHWAGVNFPVSQANQFKFGLGYNF